MAKRSLPEVKCKRHTKAMDANEFSSKPISLIPVSNDTDLLAYLTPAKSLVNDDIASILHRQTKAAKDLDPVYGTLLTTITSLLHRGGKRLRPIMTLLAYDGFGGQDQAAIIPVASSQELFHAFILMHDDVIDRDTTRWGGLNISGSYFERFSKTLPARDALHFAEAWGILAGDICLNLSQEVLLSSNFSADKRLVASGLMQRTLFEMVGGEVLDVAMTVEDLELNEARLLNICSYKTAAYTFRAPLQIGALLAGADQAVLKRIEHCANNLGIGFQLQDDVLGLFGNETTTGKSALSDVREGKLTLLMMYGLQQADAADQTMLRTCLGNPDVTIKDLVAIKKILTTSGARARVEALAEKYLTDAMSAISELGCRPAITDLLLQLTSSLVGRQK